MERYRKENKERISQSKREWYFRNKESHLKKMRLYRKTNRDKLRTKKRQYVRRKVLSDKGFKLSRNLRTRLYIALKNNQKRGSAVELLGCSIEEFMLYLENQFEEGMSWDNYGDWHVDHVIPLSSFNLEDETKLKEACNYLNLQPLWASDNLSKGDKSWQ